MQKSHSFNPLEIHTQFPSPDDFAAQPLNDQSPSKAQTPSKFFLRLKILPEEKDMPSSPLKKRCSPFKSSREKRTKPLFPAAEKASEKQALLGSTKNIRKISSLNISAAKKGALIAYKDDPAQCTRFYKSLIFKEIKQIEWNGCREDLAVEGLMLCLSERDQIDLALPLCRFLTLDVFIECNQETSVELAKWLCRQKTFSLSLLKECLRVFEVQNKSQLALDPFAVRLLIDYYKEQNWHLLRDENLNFLLPVNDEHVIEAMAILIKLRPHENWVINLVDWMMQQDGFELGAFSCWMEVFKLKEDEAGGRRLNFVLMDKMIAYFQKRWNVDSLLCLEIDQELKNYIKLRVGSSRADAIATNMSASLSEHQFSADSVTFHVKEAVSEGVKDSSLALKLKNLTAYKENPESCSRIKKGIIFRDICEIEMNKTEGKLISITEIILHLSPSKQVDLKEELSHCVILDTFREGNQEMQVQLSNWLGHEATLQSHLFLQSLSVFNEKFNKRMPINSFALEILIKIYHERQWYKLQENQQNFVSVNHPDLVKALAIIIHYNPNEDRVRMLTEEMMNLPGFNLTSFSEWVKVFKQKEEENKITIYFPLLKTMLIYFQKEWGDESLSHLDKEVADYLRCKIQQLNNHS